MQHCGAEKVMKFFTPGQCAWMQYLCQMLKCLVDVVILFHFV